MSAHASSGVPAGSGVCLDWREGCHWSYARLECVHCQARTNLRDAAGQPSHKTCVEAFLDAAAIERTDADVGVLRSTGAAA